MQTAKLFNEGRSQAVRLPKEYRFNGDEVYIKKYQGIVMLLPMDSPWTSLHGLREHFSSDFMEDRHQPNSGDQREGLWSHRCQHTTSTQPQLPG